MFIQTAYGLGFYVPAKACREEEEQAQALKKAKADREARELEVVASLFDSQFDNQGAK